MSRTLRRWGGNTTFCEVGLIIASAPELEAARLLAVGVHHGSYALQAALHAAGHPQVSRHQCRQHLTTPERSATACRCPRPYPAVAASPVAALAPPPVRRRNPTCGVAVLRSTLCVDDCDVLDAMLAEWPVTETHSVLTEWLGDESTVSYAVLRAHAAGDCRCPRHPLEAA